MVDRGTGSQGGGESSQGGLSLREFGRRIGVSDTAVRKAIKAGRLKDSLGNGGKIINFDLAQREWAGSSRTAAGVRTEPRTIGSQSPEAVSPQPSALSPAPVRDASATADEPVDEDGTGQLVFGRTLIDAQTLATNERARKLKFENDVTEGRLVPVERVTKEAFEAERIIRENMLNLVARVGGELHAERDLKRFLIKFEGYIHQGLNTAADALLAVNG